MRDAVPIAAPEFTEADRLSVEHITKLPVWAKIKAELDYRLVCRLLDPRVTFSDDLRRGWLACRAEMDELPMPIVVPKPDSDETTSIQYVTAEPEDGSEA